MEDVLVQPPGVLKLVSHEVRWNLLQHLSQSDYRVNDLVGRLHLPQNLVSYHLKQLHAFEQTSLQLSMRIRFLLTLLERKRRNREF